MLHLKASSEMKHIQELSFGILVQPSLDILNNTSSFNFRPVDVNVYDYKNF